MAVEVEQIAWRGQLEHGALWAFFDEPFLRLGWTDWLGSQQGEEFGMGGFSLCIDGKRVEIAPDPRQPHGFDRFAQQIAQQTAKCSLAFGDQFPAAGLRGNHERSDLLAPSFEHYHARGANPRR